MKVTMDEDQMLEQWKLRGGLLLKRTDCTVEMTTGIDVDRLLKARMRDWYLQLLDEGAEELLAPKELAGEVTVEEREDGVGEIELPDGCRRVLRVRLENWKREAMVTTGNDRLTAMRQKNRYSRGGAVSPVAVVEGRRLLLYSVPAGGGEVATLTVAMEEDGVYELDERALSTIPTIE